MLFAERVKKMPLSDVKKVFGTNSTFLVKETEENERKLKEWEDFDHHIIVGDIIEYNQFRYYVTNIYTDKTIDVMQIDGDSTIENVSIYGLDDVYIIDYMKLIEDEI